MNKSKTNTETERACFRCKQVFPLSSEFFYKDSARIFGLSYECKICLRKRKKGRDRRVERWANMSAEQRQKVKNRHIKYNRTEKARAVFLASAYKKFDEKKNLLNDITSDFIFNEIFTKKCVYCNTEYNLGCDRIDNSKGHLISNVVPSCGDCNVMRGDRFTHKEMLIIGKTISQVKIARDSALCLTENDSHL